MSVKDNIKKRRYELKMSQHELATAMGYKCRATIAKIESGENDISQSKLQKIAKILDTTIEALIGGSSISTPANSITTSNHISIDNSSRPKNAVIIMAGGKSSRNQQNIPNQFINVMGKPILVYCMESYQYHPTIDDIYIVCLKGWESIVNAYPEQFQISKFRGTISAGIHGILSVKNGIESIKANYSDDDVVIIQESTRPMVSIEMISKLLQACNDLGSANICQPMKDYLQFTIGSNKSTKVNRENTVEVQSPETFKFSVINNLFVDAIRKHHHFSESCCATFLDNLGYNINFIEGSVNNIKIIRQEDLSIFVSLLHTK